MSDIEDRSKVNSIIVDSSTWEVPKFEIVYTTANYGEYQKVKELFENQEDYVCVTRCKDCKYFTPHLLVDYNNYCYLYDAHREQDEYCSKAEKNE